MPSPLFLLDRFGTTAGGLSVIALPFRSRRQANDLSLMPGSTDAALAVKTERLPPYGLPPITAGAERF